MVTSHRGLPCHLLQLPHLRRGPYLSQSDRGPYDCGGQLLLPPVQQVPQPWMEHPESSVLDTGHNHWPVSREVYIPPSALW